MNISEARAAKRALLTEALADVALEEGIDALSLRPAAARLGTSDRMLLYYFGTKAELVGDVLACVAERFAAYLSHATRNARIPSHYMVGHTADLMATPAARPFAQLWLEVAARAGRGDPLFVPAAEKIAESWNAWIVRSVHFPVGVTPRNAAAMMLAIVNGIIVLDVTSPNVANAAKTRVQAAAA